LHKQNLIWKIKLEDLILISTLNDFIFCPYSIYLHNVYAETDEDIYHAVPQTKGQAAHKGIDGKTSSTKKSDLLSLPVSSEELGVMGKIDIYRLTERWLIERKYQLKQIFRGQIYQLWAQYFCLCEMGYEVERISFYEISTNRMIPVDIPNNHNKSELCDLIRQFRQFNPNEAITVTPNKCAHCIYCSLCDKTQSDNVYT